MEGELRSRARDVALFAVVAVASAFAWKLIAALAVAPDAAQAGVSIWEVVKKTTTHYPLPPLFDFASHFRGISAFPRDPSIQMLGPLAPLILSLPFALAARCALRRRWNGHLLLFLAIPAYVAAVSVINSIYTHYFLPVVVMLPALLPAAESEYAADGADAAASASQGWKDRLFLPFVALVLVAAGLALVSAQTVPPAVSQAFYSRVYNLPMKNVWGMNWPLVAVFALASTTFLAFANGRGTTPVKAATWFLVALVAGSVAFAAYPAV